MTKLYQKQQQEQYRRAQLKLKAAHDAQVKALEARWRKCARCGGHFFVPRSRRTACERCCAVTYYASRGEWFREYRQRHAGRIKEYNRYYRETHAEKIKQLQKRWKDANPEKVKQYIKVNTEKRRQRRAR